MVDRQTRDSLGHSDQTQDHIFAGAHKEYIKVRAVNETHLIQENDGFWLDSEVQGQLNNSKYLLDGTDYVVDIKTKRRWDWKTESRLRSSPTAQGTLVDGGVRLDLDLNE